MLTFQEMIIELTQYWAEQGCLIHQGYDLEVGAGTFNPATFLRSLGPEPYAAVYVEPSRRPKDGRYGDNPNRVQHYHQMQVIFKPSPKNILDLYLNSLKRVGLNLDEHDIRFVHDDWENPTIGAWGLGWEIWLDGMEVTQFTYFQAVGGLPVKPVSGEITYGLERLAMYLQGVDSMFDIKWNKDVTYGDIFKRSEWEWSHYNFHEANAKMWLSHFDDFEREVKALIKKRIPIPAYDFVMKASHAFNLLDARGVISVTERTGYIGRIRALAKEIAEAFIESRKEQEYPLLKNNGHVAVEQRFDLGPIPEQKGERQDFLLEIGSEELPATFVPVGMANLEKGIRELLEAHSLNFEELKCFGTPRRLAVQIKGLITGIPSSIVEKKGPSFEAAFDKNGQLTQAGLGFFRSLGIAPLTLKELDSSPIELRDLKGTKYLFAKIKKEALSTPQLLSRTLPDLILGIDFPKKMRWENLEIEYARPIRWIVSLFGSEVIPFYVGNVSASRTSFGHRQLSPHPIPLERAEEYVGTLKKHDVIVDCEERKALILEGLHKIEEKEKLKALSQELVLPQVLHLTEKPFVTLCSFDPSYLKAPKEVLISEMVEHQKYFPLSQSDGSLAPKFAVVCNNKPQDKIRHGNERALSPRLADGLFLFEEDKKIPLEHFNEKLKNVTFQKSLGTVYEKMERVLYNSILLQRELKIGHLNLAKRAALLSKADLVTLLVGEFPELQGVVGHLYALSSGEDKEVARAIEEQWMPRGEKGELPKTDTGVLLSLAEKMDNFLGCFSLSMIPTSSSDPYGLRRQALGVIRILIERKAYLPLEKIFLEAFERFLQNTHLEAKLKKSIEERKGEIVAEIITFISNRFRTVLLEMGFEKDEIEAILARPVVDIYETYLKIAALNAFRKAKGNDFSALLTIHTRTKKILEGKKEQGELLPSLFVDESEKVLFEKVGKAKRAVEDDLKNREYAKAFELLSSLHAPLNALFDHVKILDDDPKIQKNRKMLLREVLALSEKLCDLGKIQEH